MRTLLFLLIPALLALPVGAPAQKPAPNVVPTDPLLPEDERKAFQLPPGFVAQLVAADPDIRKPLNLAFDDLGRLWVTETEEYPYPAPPDRKPKDAVKILSNFGPDGRARTITTFADGLNIPIGVLPLPGGKTALVHSIPAIHRLADTKGTGKADTRSVLLQRYGFKDTHGMTSAFTFGFDGWVYACHGFANASEIRGGDGKSLQMQSGNIYRFRPDGSHIESFTHGQVNPFGLSLDPLGNLYSADCHSQPIYQLLRGAYYPSFGKPHDGLGFGPTTITDYRGSTAISGIAYYDADAFPPAYRGDAYVGDVITNEIVRFRLRWQGSTPHATQAVLLRSKDQWFRPVDVKLGPDGALYIADFYNRIIGHYEVPLNHPGRDRRRGRIWRIVYKGPDSKPTPAPRQDFTAATPAQLASDLGHPNLTVRLLATQQLVTRGKAGGEAVHAALKASDNPWQQAHGLWVLQRTGALDEATLEKGLKAREAVVRVHARRILAERPRLTDKQRERLLEGLKDADAHVRRASADALGQHANPDNLRPLMALIRATPAADTHLLHTARMALRDQLLAEGAWKSVALERWEEADARLLASASLGAHDPGAARFLLWVIERWPGSLARVMETTQHIARHGDADTRQGLLPVVRKMRPADLIHQRDLAVAFQKGLQARGQTVSPGEQTWMAGVAGKLLDSPNAKLVQAGAELVGQVRLAGQEGKLIALAGRGPEPSRLAALGALAALDAGKNAAVLGKALSDTSLSPDGRQRCAVLLGQANRPQTQAQLLAALPIAPARLQNAIAAGLAGNRAGAEELLKAVAAGKASARLLQERAVVVRLEASKLPKLAARLAKLTAGLPPVARALQDLLNARRAGFARSKASVARGAKVFEKHCANCHQVAGKGARIGPQLDGIGLRGLDRLLEDTLDPSRNVDAAFRTTVLMTKRGVQITGLFLREEGAVLVLADAQGKETRVEKANVAERTLVPLSPMPDNFATSIPEAEFHDLLAWLLAQRPR